MQSLAQYSEVKTLARSDALDLLAVHAQLAGSNAIPRRCSLARMKGDGRPVLLLVPGGALIAAIVVSSLLASVWLWLYLTAG